MEERILNGGVIKVGRTLSLDDLRAAFREAEDGYIPEDAVFHVTDYGMAHEDGCS